MLYIAVLTERGKSKNAYLTRFEVYTIIKITFFRDITLYRLFEGAYRPDLQGNIKILPLLTFRSSLLLPF